MKKGEIINTPHGKGMIECIENYSRLNDAKRVCVILKDNPFDFPIVCYWESELN